MKNGSAPTLEEDLARFLSSTEDFAKARDAIQSFHNGRQSWSEAAERLRAASPDPADDSDSSTLLFCALTLKHHAYDALRRFHANSDPNVKQLRLDTFEELCALCLLFQRSRDTIRRQLLYALCGLIINFFDIGESEHGFLLSAAMLRFDENQTLQCELLCAFPEELFNECICVSVFSRADLVRASVMFAPRIFGRLFAWMNDKSQVGQLLPMRAMLRWLEMHTRLVRTFGGTHEYVPSEEHGSGYKFNLDAMGAKLPRDDAVLIRNSLNAFGAIGGIFSLFERLRQAVVGVQEELCEATCEALVQFYSLTQFDLMGMMQATSQRYNEAVSQSNRHWSACSKGSISQLPCIVTDSCQWAMDFLSEIPGLFGSGVARRKSTSAVQHDPTLTRMLCCVMELLVVIAAEHLPFTILFAENHSPKAAAICMFVKELVHYPEIRCRELCLDFYASLLSILFAVKDTMSEPHFSTCVMRIVQTMRHMYTEFVRQLLKSASLSFDVLTEAEFVHYRSLVAAFIDEALHVIGVNMLLQLVQDQVKVLDERFDWVKAEMCAFLLRCIAHRLAPELDEGIIVKYLSVVCKPQRFRELYESKSVTFASSVHRSISECIVLTCGVLAQDVVLLKAAQRVCLMDFCEDNRIYWQHCARALRSLALCAEYSTCDVFDLMRRIALKIAQSDCPPESRIELLGGIADLLGTFNESAKVRLRRDFVDAMSMRLNRLLDSGQTANMSDEIALYISTLCLIDFRPCFSMDVNGYTSNECLEVMRRNHESATLRRIKGMNAFWPQVEMCQGALPIDEWSTEDEVENMARWLLWVMKESHFGSRSQLLALKTVSQSTRLCEQDRLLNRCMDLIEQYAARLLDVMMDGVDLPAVAVSAKPEAGVSRKGVHKEVSHAEVLRAHEQYTNSCKLNGKLANGSHFHASHSDESQETGSKRSDPRSDLPRGGTSTYGAPTDHSHPSASSTDGSHLGSLRFNGPSSGGAEAESQSSQAPVVVNHIIFNVNRFRFRGDFSGLRLFTSAFRAALANQIFAPRLLSWSKISPYLTFMLLLLPTYDSAINREIVELFGTLVLWTRRTRQEAFDGERQKRRVTRNSARAMLLGKHFMHPNVTMAEFMISSILKALLSRPCHVEVWLPAVTRVVHTLIASNSFYPIVAASIKSCMKASPNERRRLISRRITMWSSAREVRQMLWMLSKDRACAATLRGDPQ